MPARSSHVTALGYRRPQPPRRRARRWPWLIVALLLAAAVYTTLKPPGAPPLPLPLPLPAPTRIGIVAGHWQYDSGAICPDGLREVDVTLPIARGVVERLKAQGYEAEVLSEYDSRLKGYRAAALVSLHADSCTYDLSGYKCVGATHLLAARDSALLVESLRRSYSAATGLLFHENTITLDMLEYHAFQRIDPRTPAAIVELGFMSGDRELLTTHVDRAARGIADGVILFLSVKAEQQPTATPMR